MGRRLIVASVVTAVVGLGAVGAYLAVRAGGSPAPSTVTAGPALAAQTVSAGEVSVRVEPVRLDGGGAEFRVTFDTHSGALDLDMTAVARLQVDGVAWPLSGWTGDGPGGHHRQGQLSFRSGGPATGSAHLTIGGLPAPVDMAWDLTAPESLG